MPADSDDPHSDPDDEVGGLDFTGPAGAGFSEAALRRLGYYSFGGLLLAALLFGAGGWLAWKPFGSECVVTQFSFLGMSIKTPMPGVIIAALGVLVLFITRFKVKHSH